jgi:hypothetical protein
VHLGARHLMAMPAFQDSAISQAEYDNETHQLQVWFRDSAANYTYENVPTTIYENLLSAASKSRYFELNIRGRYPYTRG